MQTIFGINAVTARLKAGPAGVSKLLMRDGRLSDRLTSVEQLARKQSVAIERLPGAELDRMTGAANQGVALVVDEPAMLSEPDLDRIVCGSPKDLLILVLDGVTDPRNLGACLRSAATFGVDAVVVPKDHSAALTPAAVKTASGGAALVPLVQVVNLSRCLTSLRKQNVWIVGTLLDAESTLDALDLTGNIALVMGSEGRGLRKNTVRHCDLLARIPMIVEDLGLNVSVAAGIALYEASRQRGA